MSLTHPKILHDLVQMMMGGGSNQRIIPRVGGNVGPTQQQVYGGMRQGVTSLSGADAISNFHDNPNLLNGVQMAVALPMPALKIAAGGKAAKTGRLLGMMQRAHNADAEQLLSHYKGEDMHGLSAMLDSLPRYTGQKVKHGRLYHVDPQGMRGRRPYDKADAFKDPRIAIIQDPKTGAMFTAGPDFHHGEIANAVDKTHYVKHNPDYVFDPQSRFQIPPAMPHHTPGASDQWMQHEVWAKQEFPRLNGRLEPLVKDAAVNFTNNSPHPDSVAATIGRSRLLRDLKKYGFDTRRENPEGTTALTRLMRDKYGVGGSMPPAFPDGNPYKGSH